MWEVLFFLIKNHVAKIRKSVILFFSEGERNLNPKKQKGEGK